MRREERCPYDWDTEDPIDQGGSAPNDYQIALFTCDRHKMIDEIPPYLHLWDEAEALDLGEHKEDWEFTKRVHSILFDVFNISHGEVEWTCAGGISNLKQQADQMAKVLKNGSNNAVEETCRKTLQNILGVGEKCKQSRWLVLAVKYYMQFLFAAGKGELPFPSFESFLYAKKAMEKPWNKII